LVCCEPAITWWNKTHSHHNYHLIVLYAGNDKKQTQAKEAQLIALFQPSLNTPMIYKFFNYNPFGKTTPFTMPKSKYRAGLRNMWKKYRTKIKYAQWNTNTTSLAQLTDKSWDRLFTLSQHGRQSFEAQRAIRSPRFDSFGLYLLFRQSNNMEEPNRSRAHGILKRAMTHHNLTVPRNNLGLITPFLAHQSFKKNCQQWIKDTVYHQQHLC